MWLYPCLHPKMSNSFNAETTETSCHHSEIPWTHQAQQQHLNENLNGVVLVWLWQRLLICREIILYWNRVALANASPLSSRGTLPNTLGLPCPNTTRQWQKSPEFNFSMASEIGASSGAARHHNTMFQSRTPHWCAVRRLLLEHSSFASSLVCGSILVSAVRSIPGHYQWSFQEFWMRGFRRGLVVKEGGESLEENGFGIGCLFIKRWFCHILRKQEGISYLSQCLGVLVYKTFHILCTPKSKTYFLLQFSPSI